MKSALGTARSLVGVSLVAALAAIATPAAADGTLKVFRSTMPDGTVVLGDKPTAGAKSVASDTYALSTPRTHGAAEVERDYWRGQSEAFNRRQLQREAGQRAGGGRMSSYHRDDLAMYGDAGQQPPSYYGHAARPQGSLSRVPRNYTSSPGAVRGRESGFIGSGFSTSR